MLYFELKTGKCQELLCFFNVILFLHFRKHFLSSENLTVHEFDLYAGYEFIVEPVADTSPV